MGHYRQFVDRPFPRLSSGDCKRPLYLPGRGKRMPHSPHPALPRVSSAKLAGGGGSGEIITGELADFPKSFQGMGKAVMCEPDDLTKSRRSSSFPLASVSYGKLTGLFNLFCFDLKQKSISKWNTNKMKYSSKSKSKHVWSQPTFERKQKINTNGNKTNKHTNRKEKASKINTNTFNTNKSRNQNNQIKNRT